MSKKTMVNKTHKAMNLNELAEKIASYEGGKKNLSIAQIKEVLACLGTILYWDCTAESANQIVAALIKKGKK